MLKIETNNNQQLTIGSAAKRKSVIEKNARSSMAKKAAKIKRQPKIA